MAQLEIPQAAVSAEDLRCPLCDYDLRGLIDPRCPECGYTFEWDDLRDPARRKHKYLFEHHPERNVRSFLRTMIGGLRPRKFWTGLLPSQPSHPRRLAIYATIVLFSALLPAAALTIPAIVRDWMHMAANRREFAISLANPADRVGYVTPPATTQQAIERNAPAPTVARVLQITLSRSPALFRLLVLNGIMLLWPTATLAALMIFQISLRRAHLRRVHLVRCIVYCADVIVWGNLLLIALAAGYVLRALLTAPAPRGDPVHLYAVAAALLAIAMLPIFIYRMIVALKEYLRFDRPISTIVATQIIVLLLTASVLVNLG